MTDKNFRQNSMLKSFLYSFILILLLCSYTQSQTPRGADSASVSNGKFNLFSYKISEMPIEDALLYIANKSNVKLAFSKDIFLPDTKVSLNIKNVSAEDAIENILAGTNASLVNLADNKYVIKAKKIYQHTGSLRGLVTDSTTGEALAFANVYIQELNRGASTNNKGIFIVTAVPPGEYNLLVSYVGYQSKNISAKVVEDKLTHVDFRLSPNSIEIKTVEKVGERVAESNATDLGLERIAVKDLEKLPQGVETDIFRSLQYIPGVKSAGDISARFYVRGSPSNQNLILLNNAPIYHPYHSLGMFSSIDPEMINNIEFYKGGYPIELGGALSSITKLITKDGNKYKFGAKAQASMLTGKASLEGPLGEGSFLFTGRKSYDTRILKYFLDEKNLPIEFYDMSLGLNFPNLLPNGNVKIFGYISNDHLDNASQKEADFKWANKLVGINWFQLADSPMLVELNFYYSIFEGEVIQNFSSVRPQSNRLDDINLDVNLRYIYDSKDELDLGFKLQEVSSKLVLKNYSGSIKDISEPKGTNIDFYIKYKFLRYDNFGLDIGTRINLTRLATGRKGTGFFEPRINSTFRLNPNLAIKWSAGIFTQEIITLSDEDELINIFEPWFITPPYLPPSHAVHLNLGCEYKLSEDFSMDAEVYKKSIVDFATLNDQKIEDTDPELIAGKGTSYGLEYQFNYTPFPYRFHLGYSFAFAEKTANNKTYTPRYDSRHSLNLAFEYNIGSGWYASVSWNYYSGLPFTQILGFRDKWNIDNLFLTDNIWASLSPFVLAGARNSQRLPDYHRLDLNVSKTFRLGFVNLYLDLSLINLYDRDNIFYFEKTTGKRVNMLPFLPTASIKAEI
ncbi:MAG: hypothetical protein A2068_06915 [Ignavibacteria bacterium GWB2_35_6b]|nr:MAG: hypothetical protein A2068_06915 [Ignavibacteria bacterium GWB2_35_6b]